MRDPKRIKDFMERLEVCWEKVPDWRFLQLICNIPWDRDPFFIEDEEAIRTIEAYFHDTEKSN